jgi:ABC-type multidrug transport system permease subunit
MNWVVFSLVYLLFGVLYEKVIFNGKVLKWSIICIATWPLFLVVELLFLVAWKISSLKKKSLKDTDKH